MTDLTPALKAAIDIFLWYFTRQFTVFGFTFNVAAVYIFVGIASIAIWFTLKLND